MVPANHPSGKIVTTTAKLHGSGPGGCVHARPTERRMLLSRLNFKLVPGAGKHIAWVSCGRSNAVIGNGSWGRASTNPIAKGKTINEL
jgi:hypothetical protein